MKNKIAKLKNDFEKKLNEKRQIFVTIFGVFGIFGEEI